MLSETTMKNVTMTTTTFADGPDLVEFVARRSNGNLLILIVSDGCGEMYVTTGKTKRAKKQFVCAGMTSEMVKLYEASVEKFLKDNG